MRDNFLSDLMFALPAHVHERWKEVGDGHEQANEVEEAEIEGGEAAADRKVEGAGVARHWERHQDYDHADQVLDREAKRQPIDAQSLQRIDLMSEAQVQVHLMEVSEEFAEGPDDDPVDDPGVGAVEGDHHEDDEQGPGREQENVTLHRLNAYDVVEDLDEG